MGFRTITNIKIPTFQILFYFQATITGYQTNSVQTKKSNFRYSVPVQTIQLRDTDALTKKNNYVNLARPSNFLFGLRGRIDDNQHIVDLTRPVNEERYRSCATAMSFPPPCKVILIFFR